MSFHLSKKRVSETLTERDESAATTLSGIVSAGFLWKSRLSLFGIPFVCVAYGRDEKGRPLVAKGLLSIGQFAIGLISIGQFSLGIFSLGQVSLGIIALAQVAVSPVFALGQISIATFAVGQLVVGKFARGQFGWAEYLWSPNRTDMEAVAMFETIEWLIQQDWSVIYETLKDAVTLGI